MQGFHATIEKESRVASVVNYVLHLLTAGLLVAVFFVIYTWITPYNEIALIKAGNVAAALSLGGALLGFSLTVVSGILHNSALQGFLMWSAGAAVVQIAAYFVTSRLLRGSKDQIESGNVAFGGALAAVSISVGAINAACLS